MISTNPNEVHIYNGFVNADTVLALSSMPSEVSVSPDGLYAARWQPAPR